MEKNLYDFLKEYEQLCQKYNLGFGGCGCCGSPFVGLGYDNGYFKDYVENVNYDYEKKQVIIRRDWDEKTIDEFFEKVGD